MRGLYAILDLDCLRNRGRDPLSFGSAVLSAGVAALQIRAKHAAARDIVDLARALAPHARQARTPLLVNDRPDLALVADADGVHVGQDDVPLDVARAICGGRWIVGVSTHSRGEAMSAFAAGASYVGFGPIFATSTKASGHPAAGVAALAALVRDVPGPVVAIGGIDRSTIESVGATGCAGAAVIGALLDDAPGAGLAATARDLHASFLRGAGKTAGKSLTLPGR